MLNLVITDRLPLGVTFAPTGATGGGILVGDTVQWEMSALEPGKRADLEFQVRVNEGTQVVNAPYGVRSAEGVRYGQRDDHVHRQGGQRVVLAPGFESSALMPWGDD